METVKYYICLCLISVPVIQANPASAPSVEVSVEQLNIAAGASGSVTCTPGGYPLPSVQWRKYEGGFGAGTTISGDTLTIGDAQDGDRGYYMCVGVLGATEVAHKFVYVEIENADPPPSGNSKVTVSQRTISIPTGGQGSIVCNPEGNPLPTVEWKKSDGEFGYGVRQSGNTLIISDARKEDQGDYVCQGIVQGTDMITDYARVVIEDAVPPPPGNSKVTVSQRTISIPKGRRGSIVCVPEGNPLPTVEWKKSDGEFGDGVTQSGNTLIISDAREEDQGDYVCQGIVQGTVMITDYARVVIEVIDPLPPGNSKVTVSQRTISIPKGGRGSIVCIPEGNPMPTVEWKRSDGDFSEGVRQSGNTLIVSDAREKDQGDYVCQGIVQGTVMITDYARVVIEVTDPLPPGNSKVTVSQRTISIPKGGRGSIVCIPEGNPMPTVEWKRSDGDFSEGVRQSGNTLIISDAREEDQGDYVCQGIVQGTVMIMDYARVVIEGIDPLPPGNSKVTVSQRTISIPKGGRGSIVCIPEGNPMPTVEWKRSDGDFSEGVRQSGNTLIISDAREEDQGDYVCQGIVQGTVMITDYARVVIEVTDPLPPGNSKVTVSQRTISIPKGGRGSIVCIPEGNPMPTVEWKRSDGDFSEGVRQSGNTLIISDAREEDQGDYVCQGIVQGTVMIMDYARVVIEVIDPLPPGNSKVTVSQRTISIPKGGRGSIVCIPEGNPMPTVEWKRSDGDFSEGVRQSGNTLIVSDAREKDQGDYVCQGIVQGTVMITDYARVVIEDAVPPPPGNSKVTVSQRTISIPKGGRGNIVCNPEGNPLPTVEWKKSDGEFSDGVRQSGNTLIISDAREEDQGDYVCQGIVQGTVMITDYARVEITTQSNLKVTVSQRTLLIPLGGRGTIECTPEGNPLPRVQWIKSDGEFRDGIIQSGNTLIISDARQDDRGHYVCQGIVDGTVILTNYSSVEIDTNPATAPVEESKVEVSATQLKILTGKSGSVTCNPGGNPLPSIRWSKHGGEFGSGTSVSDNKLTIAEAQEGDRGYYLCVGLVGNAVVAQKYVYVEIENGVSVTTSSSPRNLKLVVSERQLKIAEGENGSIECTPEGEPLPTVHWIKANGEFRDGISQSGNTLIISDARREDRGHYTCQGIVDGTVMLTNYSAIDIAKRSQTPVPVTTQMPRTTKVTVSKKQLRIRLGESGSIECTPQGNPLPTVRWIKSDGEFRSGVGQSGNLLIISDAQKEDRGHYVCQGIVDGTLMATGYSAVEIESNEGRPDQLPRPVDMIIKEGADSKMSCDFDTGDNEQLVTWTRRDQRPLPQSAQSVGNELIIHTATQEDSGEYLCRVTASRGGFVLREALFRLEVLILPLVSVHPAVQTVNRGQAVTVKCEVDVEGALVTWEREDKSLSSRVEDRGSQLYFSGIEVEDAGYYRCSVQNRAGISSGVAQVIVKDPTRLPSHAKLIVSERELIIPTGGSATIECTPEGNPLPRVQWIKSNGEFRDGVRQSGNTLIISDAREEDRGHYVCQGVVDGTLMLTNYSRVDVRDEPQTSFPVDLRSSYVIVSHKELTIPVGETVSIGCTPEGSPLPTVLWKKSNGEFRDGVRQSGNTLIISDAREEDRGHYVCQGIVAGTVMVTDYSRVDVDNNPQTTPTPNPRSSNVIVSHKELTIPIGETVSIGCTPEGRPMPTVRWTKSNGEFRDGVRQSGNTLIISDAREEDRGHYACQGIVAGTVMVTDYSRVDVENNPQTSSPANLRSSNVIVSHKELTIPIRETVSIGCTPEGSPLPTVRWIKSNGEFRDGVRQSGNMLIISDAREEDRGHYACQGIVAGTVMVTDYSRVDVDNNPQTTPTPNPRSSNVIVSHKELTIPIGETVSIGCTPEGRPLPTVRWTKSNGEFRDGVRQSGNTLIISDAREEDRGHYACQGIVAGTVMVTDYSRVDVDNNPQTTPTANPRSSNVIVSHKELTIPIGETVSIGCTPEGLPLPTVRWTKSNGEFRDGVRQSGNTLIISDAREEDRGHYACQGIVAGTVMVTDYSRVDIEDGGQPPVGDSRVQVTVRHVKIPSGGNRSVECTPEGNPLPTIQWSKYEGAFGVGTRQSGNALVITDAREQDGGNYVCEGLVDGTVAWTDYLAVEIESTQSISQSMTYPRVTVNMRHLKIPRGGSMAVECTPEGSPLPTIQWTKHEGNFGVGTAQAGNSLVIKDAQEEDRGNYVCSAVMNGVSVFSDYLTVDIQYYCELPKDAGPCRAAYDRWYYNPAQQKCEKFVWGGCDGNKNNFETEEQCSLECESMRPVPNAA